MMKYLLDTDTCIYALKRKPQEVADKLSRHENAVCISAVTLMELYFGAEKSSRPEQNRFEIDYFVANLVVLDYNAAAAAHTADIRAELSKRGTPIGPYDSMIAGHARSQGLICVTNNVREFGRVDGLRVENWCEAAE